MARTLDDVRDQALALSPEERGALAEELLDSLSVEFVLDVRQAWISEARRRLADLKSGHDVGLTRAEFFADE